MISIAFRLWCVPIRRQLSMMCGCKSLFGFCLKNVQIVSVSFSLACFSIPNIRLLFIGNIVQVNLYEIAFGDTVIHLIQ